LRKGQTSERVGHKSAKQSDMQCHADYERHQHGHVTLAAFADPDEHAKVAGTIA